MGIGVLVPQQPSYGNSSRCVGGRTSRRPQVPERLARPPARGRGQAHAAQDWAHPCHLHQDCGSPLWRLPRVGSRGLTEVDPHAEAGSHVIPCRCRITCALRACARRLQHTPSNMHREAICNIKHPACGMHTCTLINVPARTYAASQCITHAPARLSVRTRLCLCVRAARALEVVVAEL